MDNPSRQVSWRITALQVLCVFAVSILLRLIYAEQLSHTYFFAPFKGGYDDYIFDNWALDILRGNWLGDRAIYIYRMPLYVYFLSFVYYLFGHSYWAVYITQSIIGAASCVVVYSIGRMIFSPACGLVAGLIMALYGPLLYYNGMLVGETVGIFLTCMAFLYLLFFARDGKRRHLLFAGLCIGLSMLVRGNMLIVLPFIIAWLVFKMKKEDARAVALSMAAFILGVALAVLPIIVRNYVQEKDFVPVTALGGLNIYIGNSFEADGRYNLVKRIGNNAETMIRDSIEVAENAAGRKLKPSEVSNYWVKETLASIGRNGPAYLVPLMAKKIVLFWNSYELPDIWDYYFIKRYIPIISFPLINFSVIAALAFLGAYVARVQKKDISLLGVFVVGYMVSLVAVFITSRYRIQVVPFLAVLAGYAVINLPAILKMPAKKAVTCAAIFLAAIAFCNIPVVRTSFETSYNSLGVLLKRAGMIEDAITTYNKAIEIAPNYPSPYYNLGILYRDSGQTDMAVQYFRKALEAAPDFKQARERLQELG